MNGDANALYFEAQRRIDGPHQAAQAGSLPKDETPKHLLEAFRPNTPVGEHFQPEPGCSEPTFVGSDADLTGHSARMLNAVARALSYPNEGKSGVGWIFEEQGSVYEFYWPPFHTLGEKGKGYSVRVSPEALREMRA